MRVQRTMIAVAPALVIGDRAIAAGGPVLFLWHDPGYDVIDWLVTLISGSACMAGSGRP